MNATWSLDWLDDHAETAGANAPTTPQWEAVRETYAELRIPLQNVADLDLRRRMDVICDGLAAAAVSDAPPPAGPKLSAREVDVLACAALGWTNAQVAADLGITLETVKSYLRDTLRKLRKLRCHSRLEAVATARRHGLLP